MQLQSHRSPIRVRSLSSARRYRADVRAFQQATAEAARSAGDELLARWERARRIRFKKENDLVTDADHASERRIVEYIEKRFPGHAILAEERGEIRGTAPFRWLIDPLDGTTNYAHGAPHFCVSIAVEDQNGLVAGAVLDPLRNELFEAGRGLGAFLNGRPIHVSREPKLARALLATAFPPSVWHEPARTFQLLGHFLRKTQGIRRAGCAALDLSYVAAGRYDGFFVSGLKPWDLAAGMLLVTEAGGTATGLSGGPADLMSGDLLCTNGPLHEAAARAACEAMAASLAGWPDGKIGRSPAPASRRKR